MVITILLIQGLLSYVLTLILLFVGPAPEQVRPMADGISIQESSIPNLWGGMNYQEYYAQIMILPMI